MTRKIFSSMVAVSVLALLICVSCISSILYGYFSEIIKDELKEEAAIISKGIQQEENYLDGIGHTKNRVTLVAADGTVLFDSKTAAADMENHREREEIAGALEKGSAFSVRYSGTLSTKTIYYAQRLDDGTVLRLAQEQSAAGLLLRSVIGPVMLIIAAIIIIAVIVSRSISKKIVMPINDIDLNDSELEEPYPELSPLVTKIRQQNKHIELQMNELRRTQREFNSIMENMSEGFLLIDKSMEILSYNTAALELLGDGETGKPHTAYELNRSAEFRAAVEQALSGIHNQHTLETESKYYHIISNPVMEKGHVTAAVIIVMDATEKESRDKLRREFTSNVSHELKTPLTTIYGVSDMMAEGIVRASDVEGFAKSIRDESKRMISLIDDIIKLSKLDENSFADESSPVDLLEIAKDVIERLSMKAKENNVTLLLDGEHTWISGIPALCSEIIYNLCENAIKYNKENGSIVVSVKNAHDGGGTLTVEDTGIGIPFEYRDRIFERFFRVDKSHSRQTEGTGLGLSIVKHAVVHMGGRIDVESVEGKGTKMTVSFFK